MSYLPLTHLIMWPPREGRRINALAPRAQIRVHLLRLRSVRSPLIPQGRFVRRQPTSVDERVRRSRCTEGKDSESSSLRRIGGQTARSCSYSLRGSSPGIRRTINPWPPCHQSHSGNNKPTPPFWPKIGRAHV